MNDSIKKFYQDLCDIAELTKTFIGQLDKESQNKSIKDEIDNLNMQIIDTTKKLWLLKEKHDVYKVIHQIITWIKSIENGATLMVSMSFYEDHFVNNTNFCKRYICRETLVSVPYQYTMGGYKYREVVDTELDSISIDYLIKNYFMSLNKSANDDSNDNSNDNSNDDSNDDIIPMYDKADIERYIIDYINGVVLNDNIMIPFMLITKNNNFVN